MEKFTSLSEEKQQRIIEAGFKCFGKMGYKKASAQDIAQLAGISKGMIFHYFGSKKGMYKYLIQYSYGEIFAAFKREYDPSVTDFFDRILMLTDCKISCLSAHPALLMFFRSLYGEMDPEVMDEARQIRERTKAARTDTILRERDREKFKDPAYAGLAWKLLSSYSDSYAGAAAGNMDELEAWRKDFAGCVRMLKENLYKPEYL